MTRKQRRLMLIATGIGVLAFAVGLVLYAMREIMEGAAARLAAEHASTPEIEALHDIEQSLVEAPAADAAEMARLNRAFHEAICRAARNRYLDNASRELQDWIALLGPTTFTVSGRPSTSHSEHQAIIEAIASRNPPAAETAMRNHLTSVLTALTTFESGSPGRYPVAG